MFRLMTTAALLVCSMTTYAMEWPWTEKEDTQYGYCKGFVVAGLAEAPVQDLSRTNLWLAWNAINRAELPEGSVTEEDYEAGRAAFSQGLSAGDLEGVLDTADGECGLGRSDGWF